MGRERYVGLPSIGRGPPAVAGHFPTTRFSAVIGKAGFRLVEIRYAERMQQPIRNCVAKIAEVPLVVLGSILTGWVVGTCQYFFASRVWACGLNLSGGCGLGDSEFLLAFWEGGLIGAAIAIPTGIIGWYFVLARNATVAQMRTVVLWSVLGACVLGAAASLLSVFFTPVLTLVIAGVVRVRSARV
jgi:hypothetical protein